MPARWSASLKRGVSGVPARRSGMPSSRPPVMSRPSSAPFGTQLRGMSLTPPLSASLEDPFRRSGGAQGDVHVTPAGDPDVGIVDEWQLVGRAVVQDADVRAVEVRLGNADHDAVAAVRELDRVAWREGRDDLREHVDDLGIEAGPAA